MPSRVARAAANNDYRSRRWDMWRRHATGCSAGPLALDEAVDIATQVGRGLAEAHGAGIVHRDIKPANLLITKDGTVKILDFGLAKLAGAEGVTQTGTTVGTVAYMLPEQARGQEVDHRTDVWSLGVVLFEMLTGQQPFQGENLLAISNAILGSEAASLTRLRAGTSPALARVVTRSLANSRDGRYQSVADLLGDLRGATAQTTPATRQSDVPSIAVLSFDNMSADPEQQYFCEGMAEEIINALTALDGLHVASRTSAFLAKAKSFDIAEIGTRLKVGAVLEGSVRKAGNRLRVTAQLINVSDGYHLWSERYDRDMDDVFAVQDEIAGAVVGELKVQLLGPKDAPIVTRPTENLAAYNLVLKGRHYFGRGVGLEKALECLTQAVGVDPAYAEAHAGVALIQTMRAIMSSARPRQVMPIAKEAALKALAIDEGVGDAHFALAGVLDFYEWNWAGAEREYRRALELNPGDTQARCLYADMLGRVGRAEEAIAEARGAIERDPLAVFAHHILALELYQAKRFDAAVTQAHANIELEPTYHMFHLDLGWPLGGLGRHQEAAEAHKRALSLAPDDLLTKASVGCELGFAGQRDEALEIFEDLERHRTTEYVGGVLMASVCVGLGDREQAMSWLHTAADERDATLPYINLVSAFPLESLRSDPRFQALLRRMNFPETASS